MKQKKIPTLFTTAISLQLILSPLTASAQDAGQSILNFGKRALDTAGQMINNALLGPTNQQNFQSQADAARFQQMQTPIQDKFFNSQKMASIPGLGEYLALNNINPALLNCSTLQSNVEDINIQACQLNRVKTPQDDQQVLFYNKMFADTAKNYENFLVDSNTEGQLFGVGCMKNAMRILNGFFENRINELDKLTTNLEAINNQFRESSRADLDAIEESTAVLDGGDSDLVNKVKTKRPDLFDFDKRFNNPACTSMFTAESFLKDGKAGGLNSIHEKLKDTVSAKDGDFSGESYTASHNEVVNDINNLVDKVGKQAELNFESLTTGQGFSQFLAGIQNGSEVSSTTGVNKILTADRFSDVRAKFNEANNDLDQRRSALETNLRGRANLSGALKQIKNPQSKNFEQEIVNIENDIKNNCLQQSEVKVANLESILARVRDANVTKFAQKNAANKTVDKFRALMSDPESTFEFKIRSLQSLQGEASRFQLRRDSNFDINIQDPSKGTSSQVRSAATDLNPTSFFIEHIRNCELAFEKGGPNDKVTGANVIKELKDLKASFKKLNTDTSRLIKEDLKKKLIDCESSSVANNTTPGSCTSAKFNPQKPGFCANAALSCSKNMQACTKQADKFVTDIKKERTARVTNYKALVEKNKRDIVKIFDSALGKFMKDGEAMRGMFGVGFTSPAGIEREVPEGQRFLGEFKTATNGSPDGALLLEDPDKYVAMFKKNIENLKSSVQQQQEQILGGGVNSPSGLLAKHVADPTEKNLKIAQKELQRKADECLAAHNSFVQAEDQRVADQQRQNAELGEKLPAFCKKFDDARGDNPSPGCSGEISDLISAANKAAQQTGGSDANSVAEFRSVCDQVNNAETNSRNSLDNLDEEDMCTQLRGQPKAACKIFSEDSKERKIALDTPSLCSPEKFSYDCRKHEDNIENNYKSMFPSGEKKDAFTQCSEIEAELLKIGKSDSILGLCQTETGNPDEKIKAKNEFCLGTSLAEADCKQARRKIKSFFAQQMQKDLPSVTTSAPSFCAAGNNSGPFNTKSILDDIVNRTLAGENPLGNKQ